MTQICLRLLPCALFGLLGCASNLSVKSEKSEKNANAGVPFFLPAQEIRITELGLVEDRSAADEKPLQITLVTVPDTERKFSIENSPGIFAKSQFTVNRDAAGILTSLSASSEEQVTDTAKSVITLAVAAAAAARPPANGDLKKLTDKETALIEALKGESDPLKIKALTESLKNIRELIKTKSKQPSTGTLPSREFKLSADDISVVKSANEVETNAKQLTNIEHFHVFLVPVDARPTQP